MPATNYRSVLTGRTIAISGEGWSEEKRAVHCNRDGTVTRHWRGAWRRDDVVSRDELRSMDNDTARAIVAHLYRNAR